MYQKKMRAYPKIFKFDAYKIMQRNALYVDLIHRIDVGIASMITTAFEERITKLLS